MLRLSMVLTVALVAAAVGDTVVEWSANAGLFGLGFSDTDQRSIVPTLACAGVLALEFTCARAFAMLRGRTPATVREVLRASARLLAQRSLLRDLPAIFALQLGGVYLMESIEALVRGGTVAGGLGWLGAPVLVALALHLGVCLACVVVVGALLRALVDAAVALVLRALALPLVLLVDPVAAHAAESATGAIVGTVTDERGPVPNAHVVASSPAGRRTATTGGDGRFTLLGLAPDTYAVSVESAGYQPAAQTGIGVAPGATQRIAFRLVRPLQTIGSTRAAARAFPPASTSDTFTVSGDAARATSPRESASGLATYTAGTVQGALAAVPGVAFDSFANALVRGGQVDDTVFDYDGVPIPQGLIAEPGGNIVAAQLPTTGIAYTTVTLGGYGTEAQNALGGVVNQIPATGFSPGRTTLELATGVGARLGELSLQRLWATPDLRWRYALATTVGSEDFAYGDGRTFYPAEAGTYGLALQNRSQFSTAGNVHYAVHPNDDLSLLALVGSATYDQYGTPIAGGTFGEFDGPNGATFPGERDPNAPVTFPSRVHGTYDVLKAQWLHTSAHALTRLHVYRSEFSSVAGGPFWDDLAYPDGAISLFARQGAREYGLGFDVDELASARHHLRYGLTYRVNNSELHQIVPTADEFIDSQPTLSSYLGYFGDTWTTGSRLDLTATARLNGTHVRPSNGTPYDAVGLDPHLSAAYRLGDRYALRTTFDHTTVAPKPLEADRTDSANPAPFVPLAPERTSDVSLAFEGNGRTRFRFTYFAKHELDRIDVLPENFRAAVAAGGNPSGIGVPTNAGELRAHGADVWLSNGRWTFAGGLIRAYSSSASQFAYNQLNAAAVVAGHLFPIGYLPDRSATLSYRFDLSRRVRVTPLLSYESGYPYGNGRMVWTFASDGKPVLVPNDNHLNPGYNYYFLQNPALPYDPAANPIVASLGTPEGNDPNTLRTPAQTLVGLHIEGDLSPRATLILDASNLFGTATPTQLQGNPYLIGPPGYRGGNAAYGAWYGAQLNGTPYLLGNGVPTNDGVTQSLPWTYGTGGYVPQSYPGARSVSLRLRFTL
jgi:hypothetical protein